MAVQPQLPSSADFGKAVLGWNGAGPWRPEDWHRPEAVDIARGLMGTNS
jgi:hypothetical protein